jgi:uncharacterized protein YjiS (DUF1127 family)
MSNVNHRHSSYHFLARLRHLDFGRFSAFVDELAMRRRHRRELSYVLVMPDHLLKDIGVTRGQIERELAKLAS